MSIKFNKINIQPIFTSLRKIRHQMNDLTYTILLMICSTTIAFLFFFSSEKNTANITLVYILALILTARYTNSFLYGICSSLIYVVLVNCFFTYPYFRIDFTLSGYPVTFIVMLAITLTTSATTSHLRIQSKLLSEREEMLQKADKEKMRANLLRAISHDLRTPLTSIIGTSANYLESNTLSEEEARVLLQHIYDDSTWLLHMVENLLSVTRIQDTNTKVKKTEEAIEEVISEAISRFKKRQPIARLEVKIPDELLVVPMDALLIEQVIINLLENAWVHSRSSYAITLSITHNEKEVAFHIRDYGIGIPSEHVSTIFDGMTASNSKSIDGHRGMGIGLSICKTIIEAHRGTITAMNCNPGAEFIFTLPKEDAYEC
ncbi:two-component system, OmpR family, sensor histidine kinase KdpD [Anaerosporobacter mobilis DSM 15930]|uniref:histidine kinase n=1 Tax=Anaerosporobacter mobilis DSM 15930 TaxID=1120996 RepID=A0A1M7ES57_9FIRM|nr:ATP-binding protein [Anaerosporobacter mobilis]SHL94632.1 two-component system, OmpR family, sensor histidine kinase KdpD [Anaerosporobacter mobilis DSM 15930]